MTTIIVTWNGWPILDRCLRSLETACAATGPLAIVVVDNASTDGTAERLAAAYPHVRWRGLADNLGFAAANNAALPAAQSELLFLLNNDTIVEPDAISALIAAARAQPEFAVFVPQMLRLKEPDVVDNRGIYLDASGHVRQLDAGLPRAPERARCEVFGGSGGALLLRREVVERCGLFDESLGSYLEDADFACRVRAAGFRALYVPEARILHEGSATGNRVPRRKLYMIQRNMLVVHRRWFSLRPWRLASWLGVAYECGQVARAVVRRQGGVAVRAKWDAMRMSLGAPRAAADSGRLRPWLGVRSRAVPR